MPRNGSAWRNLGPDRTRNRPSFSFVSVTALAGCAGAGGPSMAQPETATAAARPSAENSQRIGRMASSQHGAIVLTERRRRFGEGRPLAVERQGQADQRQLAARPLLDNAERLGLRIGDDLVERVDRAVRDPRGLEHFGPLPPFFRSENLTEDRHQLLA